MRTGEFWEGGSPFLCSLCPAAEETRCGCLTEKGTEPCGKHRQELWANVS